MRSSRDRRLKIEDAREDLREVCAAYASVLGVGKGSVLMADLEKQFGGSVIVPGDPYATHARAGAQEVLLYMKMMIEGDQDAIAKSETAPR